MSTIDSVDALRVVLRALRSLTGSWKDPDVERRVNDLLDPSRSPPENAVLVQLGALTLAQFLGAAPTRYWTDILLKGLWKQRLDLPVSVSPSWLKLDTTLGEVAIYVRTGAPPVASADAPTPGPVAVGAPRNSATKPRTRGPRAMPPLSPPAAFAPPAGAPPSAPAPAAAAPATPVTTGGRFVNTWFEADAPVPPLERGRWYDFRLNIGPPRSGASAHAFAEPDFGSHQQLSLRVDLFSPSLDLQVGDPLLFLPRSGPSSLFSARVRPRRAGRCRLDIVLSLALELDVLQTLTVEVEAIEPRSSLGEGL